MTNLSIITPDLPNIRHNLDFLKAELTELKQRYEVAIYDENSISVAKKEVAMLNSILKDFDDKRKHIKKIFLAPYNEFERELKALESIILPAIENIASQIRESDERLENAKRDEIQDFFDSSIGALADFIKLDKIFDARWLNKTYKLEQVKNDLVLKIDNIRNDLVTIEDMQSANESQLKAIYLRTLSLSSAISENARLLRETERARALNDVNNTVKELQPVNVSTAKSQQESPSKICEQAPLQCEQKQETAQEEKSVYNLSFHATRKEFSEIHALLYRLGIKYENVNLTQKTDVATEKRKGEFVW